MGLLSTAPLRHLPSISHPVMDYILAYLGLFPSLQNKSHGGYLLAFAPSFMVPSWTGLLFSFVLNSLAFWSISGDSRSCFLHHDRISKHAFGYLFAYHVYEHG